MDTEEEGKLSELARSLARDRDQAFNLSLPFVSRLLDLALLELAMVWQGRERHSGQSPKDNHFNDLLDLKLRISLLERGSEARLHAHWKNQS